MKQNLLSIIFGLIIVTATAQQSCKCCSDDHRAFDFWEGTWTVTNPDGAIAGYSTITKIQNNCIIDENWKSASPGYTGTSHNFYNSKLDRWEQLWIDNQGGFLKLYGNRKGNQMILRSDASQNKNGNNFYQQISWTDNDDGTVRQLWEIITENEETKILFDGLYKKNN
ncbi:MAG: hypothetical protein HKP45_02165 [Winogradskyella sp.]|nr:hypothetical protein [Winogradskyella sp.]